MEFIYNLFLLIIAFTPLWVYLDATKNKIGQVIGSDETKNINFSAGGWAISILALWIIAFPVYLMQRRKLIEKAQKYPVTVENRIAKAIGLSSIGFIALLIISISES